MSTSENGTFLKTQYCLVKRAIMWGFVPIPLKGKNPIMKNWPDSTCQENLDKFTELYNKKIDFNIGIITGKVSGIIVIDIDKKDDGLQEWEKIINYYGNIPKTFSITTGSGGKHIYFKYTESVAHFENGAKLINGKGIDLKTNRGQVVFPCSIHPITNEHYAFDMPTEEISTLQAPVIADIPDWLINLLDANKADRLAKKKGPKRLNITDKTPIVNKSVNVTKMPKRIRLIKPSETKQPADKPNNDILPFEAIEEIVMTHLSLERATLYDDWIRVLWTLHNIDDSEKYLDLAHRFSKRCGARYEKEKVDLIWYNSKPDGGLLLGSLLCWFERDASQKTVTEFKIKYNFYKCGLAEYLLMPLTTKCGTAKSINENVIAETVLSELSSSIIIYEKDDAFIWNDDRKLWLKRKASDYIYTYVNVDMREMYINAASQYNEPLSDKDQFQLALLLKAKEKCESNAQIRNVVDIVRKSLSGKYIKNNMNIHEIMNAAPHLLPVRNKQIVNLKTGEVRLRTKEDYFSFECPIIYDANADKTLIEKFLYDITLSNQELIDFLQYFLGYCTTGAVDLSLLCIFHGSGSNGKSVLINLLHALLGDFWGRIHESILIANAHSTHRDQYCASLYGKRMGILSEPRNNCTLDEEQIKSLTGNDDIHARSLYKEPFTFKATCKIIMLTNNEPICSTDKAMWRRLLMVPFMAEFVENPNPNNPNEKKLILGLEEILKSDVHKSAFLNWLLIGAKRYYAGDKRIPQCVRDYTNKRRKDLDIYLQFIEERCLVEKNVKIGATDLYNAFVTWYHATIDNKPNSEPSQTKFGTAMGKMVIGDIKLGKTKASNQIYENITLKQSPIKST